ncbi:MAG: branched-chain amino acid ABC transporter permease [Nitrososphaerota archaeon]|nr:branched-chain amino acid ABC transporter permease [Nitrososphaerota archaeon]
MIYSITLAALGVAIAAFALAGQTIIVQLLVISIASGSLFAIAASGLSLTYGIQKVMNVAHGDIIILGSYAFLSLTVFSKSTLKIDPTIFIIVAVLLLGLFGVFLNSALIEPVKKYGFEPPILITFGVLIFIEAALQLIYGGNVQGINTSYSSINYVIGGVFVQYLGIVTFVSCLVVFGVMEVIISKTDLGRSIRASSQDADAAEFSGINVKRTQLIAFVMGTMLAGVGGVLYGLTQDFTPTSGPTILIIILTIIVLGGIGSLPGTFASAMIISVIDVVISYYLNAGVGYLITLVIFLVVIVVRPSGIFGRSLR